MGANQLSDLGRAEPVSSSLKLGSRQQPGRVIVEDMAEERSKQGAVQANIAGAQDIEPPSSAQGSRPQVFLCTQGPGPVCVTASNYMLARPLGAAHELCPFLIALGAKPLMAELSGQLCLGGQS